MNQVVQAFNAETAMMKESDARLREVKARLQRATRNHRKAQADLDSLRRSIFIDAATLQSAMAPPPVADGHLSAPSLHRRAISRSVSALPALLRRGVPARDAMSLLSRAHALTPRSSNPWADALLEAARQQESSEPLPEYSTAPPPSFDSINRA